MRVPELSVNLVRIGRPWLAVCGAAALTVLLFDTAVSPIEFVRRAVLCVAAVFTAAVALRMSTAGVRSRLRTRRPWRPLSRNRMFVMVAVLPALAGVCCVLVYTFCCRPPARVTICIRHYEDALLMGAIQDGDIVQVKADLRNLPDLVKPPTNRETSDNGADSYPLAAAVNASNLRMVTPLWQSGASADQAGLLASALDRGGVPMIRLLIQGGGLSGAPGAP